VTGSSPASPTVSESLARWVSALAYERLPADVVRMARRCLLDTLGCALQGSTTPEAALLRKVREDLGGSGPCAVWGRPGSAPAPVAALLITAEALRDPGVHALMAKIDLEVDPAARGERQTVEVETTDGLHLFSRVEIPRGHWQDPLSDAELRDKFIALATPALGSRAMAAADLVGAIESPGALSELLALVRQE
jgi:2-methylcitrate dehydratase PrpD